MTKHTVTKYICDECGKDIPSETEFLSLKMDLVKHDRDIILEQKRDDCLHFCHRMHMIDFFTKRGGNNSAHRLIHSSFTGSEEFEVNIYKIK